MVRALLERFLAPCRTHHLGVDWSRCESIGGCSVVGQFQRHRARQPDNSRLRDAVWRKVDRGHESRDRGERNDPPILALGHFARRRLRAVEGAEKMDPQMGFPVLARDFQKRLRLGDGGGVDNRVDWTELARRTCDELLDLVVVAHVGASEEGAAPELANFIGGRRSSFLVDLGETDIGALARKAECYLFADSASRSAHEDGLILKAHRFDLLRWVCWLFRRKLTQACRK